jgi:hypothetical protein
MQCGASAEGGGQLLGRLGLAPCREAPLSHPAPPTAPSKNNFVGGFQTTHKNRFGLRFDCPPTAAHLPPGARGLLCGARWLGEWCAALGVCCSTAHRLQHPLD